MTSKPVRHTGILLIGFGVVAGLFGCDGFSGLLPDGDGTGEAEYLGGITCVACHSNVRDWHVGHGHAQALKVVEATAPSYPATTETAGVPSPPTGFDWPDVSYVIGGYTKAANFVDINGYVLADGTAGVNTQYNLPVEPFQVEAGFVPFRPDAVSASSFEYDCFRCHTVGPESVTENGGRRQDNRPGVGGTWAEAGVQCEACHGPGSLHVSRPSAGNILVDNTSASCARCHVDAGDPDTLTAADGLIVGTQQYTEVQASPHRGFSCTVCHDPHRSVIHDRDNAIRNSCQGCHAGMSMALHEGVVFEWGDYTETVSCESCHMPFAASSSSFVDIQVTDRTVLRFGDTRSHIMYLNTATTSLADMFSSDGTEVVRDDTGGAFVSTCFVCQRCHHGQGNAFAFPSNEGCAFGSGIHDSR